MITHLRISNFKSHKATSLRMSNLTVLTGVNGCGKTSVIQALLLLRQSFLKGRLASGLDLNQPLCSIGIAHDALYRLASSGIISFEFIEDQKNTYLFEFDAENGLKDSFIRKSQYSEQANDIAKLDKLPLFNNDFQYISALRWGGRSVFPKETYAVETQRQISQNDGQGELVAHFLDKYGADIMSDYYDEKGENNCSLLQQLVYWERKISPNITIDIESGKDNNTYSVIYGFSSEDNQIKPLSELRAENIGFGISYTLPVIAALLSAPKGALIILENPEAHLHPAGQAELARLIAKVAEKGVQVVVETHSDHIINGIQLSCKHHEENKKMGIDKDKVSIHYLYGKDKHASQVVTVNITNGGHVDYQPKGFFDQAENDLYNLYKK
ncbi:DUF3696 domain-containing protein [Bacteroides xylanisolvens]|uniref:DUF3696 domain-containing protein n=1 Tax=Bacteroides xylanisolvens TaxID=371601 RepID=UPI00374E9692